MNKHPTVYFNTDFFINQRSLRFLSILSIKISRRQEELNYVKWLDSERSKTRKYVARKKEVVKSKTRKEYKGPTIINDKAHIKELN